MENSDNIFGKKAILIVGPYGSGKTTILSNIYDFFMNLRPIENIKIENEDIIHFLQNIEFDEYEVIYSCASKELDISDLLYKRLIPLFQQININLDLIDFKNNLIESITLIIEAIRKINPEATLLVLIDEFDQFIMLENESQKNLNLSIVQKLIEFIQINKGLNIIISLQNLSGLPKKFRERFYIINV